jgi:hypothetical protein
MNKLALLMLLLPGLLFVSCNKDDEDEKSERFRLLTTPVWAPNQLLVDGVDASDGLLASFNGDADFREDGTGSFADMTGSWTFLQDETQIRITTNAYPFPITANIEELTATSLIITTAFPNPENPATPFVILMGFVPK